jgi:hypothetical protein
VAEEKNQNSNSSPNWLLGLDKLTTPSFDYVGLKLRDKLRAYLNENARDRAMLRRFEKEFLYNQIDLLNYGADQYAAYLETMGGTMLQRHFQTLLPVVRFAVLDFKIQPERAFECILAGFSRENIKLSGGELILFSAAAGAMDIILTLQVAKLMFQLANVPSSVHLQNPNITNEQIEVIMQDEATMAALSNAMLSSDWGTAKWFAKTFAEIYEFEWDEEKWNAHEATVNQTDSSSAKP